MNEKEKCDMRPTFFFPNGATWFLSQWSMSECDFRIDLVFCILSVRIVYYLNMYYLLCESRRTDLVIIQMIWQNRWITVAFFCLFSLHQKFSIWTKTNQLFYFLFSCVSVQFNRFSMPHRIFRVDALNRVWGGSRCIVVCSARRGLRRRAENNVRMVYIVVLCNVSLFKIKTLLINGNTEYFVCAIFFYLRQKWSALKLAGALFLIVRSWNTLFSLAYFTFFFFFFFFVSLNFFL